MNSRCTAKYFATAVMFVLAALSVSGCGNDINEANQKLIAQQQASIEQMSQEIEAMKANQNKAYTPGLSSSHGGCDRAVQATATQRGGERFAAGEFGKALAYYQDAFTACPGDAKSEVNMARTYEAMGDKVSAIRLYRRAAEQSGPTVSDAQDQAKAALERLQASALP
jgi:tetratricopeptide (TPR) repeat protein